MLEASLGLNGPTADCPGCSQVPDAKPGDYRVAETGTAMPQTSGGVIHVRALIRFAIDHLVPVGLTAALNLAPRFGYFTLLPLSIGIEREYGNYALLLGIAGALVASASFGRVGIPFNVPAFVVTALAGLVTITPFILARTGVTLGLPPRHLDVVATFAYLGFYIVVGLLVGGCWSVVLKAVREARESEWQRPQP